MVKEVVDIKEAAQMLGVCRSTINKMCKEGILEKIKISDRRVKITSKSINNLLDYKKSVNDFMENIVNEVFEDLKGE